MLHKTLAELQKMKSGDALPYPNALVKATVSNLATQPPLPMQMEKRVLS